MNAPKEASVQPVPRPGVLVVDDEQVIAGTLAVILSQRVLETATAYDGDQAFEKAKYWKTDLLISDVVIPT